MSSPIKVAVIGAGKLGSRHAQVYSKLPGVRLVGVCDVLEKRSQDVAKACHTKAFTDYRQLLSLVDGASIVVPSNLHHKLSRDFLLEGVHLLIEKPITTTIAQADELVAMAEKKKLLIQVGHIERFNPGIQTIKKIVHNPRFIECHRLGPYDGRIADVGVTLDLMIHDIDIVLDLVRSPVKTVDAAGAFILSKTEDISNARIRFQNDAVCDLTASRVTSDVLRKIRIFQDNGYISLNYATQEAHLYTKENGSIHQKNISIHKNNSLKEELSHFIECVRHKRKPLVSGTEGRAALALALQIVKQIQAQRK